MSEKKENPVLGQPIEYTEEQIKSIQEKQAERKLQIMDDLDKIQAPIMCTIIIDPEAFEYRNFAFWQAFKERDKQVREQLSNYLNKKKQK